MTDHRLVLTTRLAAAIAAAALVLALGGCEKGPGERIGEKVDEVTGNRSGAERAGDELEDAASKTRGAAEEAGRGAKDAVN
ncbi:MAG TPA: hypothetical protein VF406_07980 [Thermodesulfobacteriota bacterium]